MAPHGTLSVLTHRREVLADECAGVNQEAASATLASARAYHKTCRVAATGVITGPKDPSMAGTSITSRYRALLDSHPSPVVLPR
jgi:hypothetical protein